MKFYKFKILTNKDGQAYSEALFEDMLINSTHIVSIRPINIVVDGEVLKGHWMRLSNGKKYKAVDIPKDFQKLFE